MPWLCIHIEILFLLTGYMSHVVLKQVLRKLHCKSVEVIETNSSKRQGRYSCETCRFSSWYLRYQRSLRYHRVPKVRLGCPQNGTKGFYHHSFKHLFLWFDCKSCFSMTQLFVMLFRFHTPLNSCRGRDTFMVMIPSQQAKDRFILYSITVKQQRPRIELIGILPTSCNEFTSDVLTLGYFVAIQSMCV